jgi:hypothetical protein
MSQRYQGGILGVGFNPLQAPNAPTSVAATAGDASATVTFTAPENVGGSAIASYTGQSNPGGIAATASASPLTFSGLTNGTAYTFNVWALNSYGPSPAGGPSGSVTPAAVVGVFAGGSTTVKINTMQYVTISTTGNSVSFGQLAVATGAMAGCSSSTRGLYGGGNTSATGRNTVAIYFITFASAGNSTSFGSLATGSEALGACSNSTRGLFAGGEGLGGIAGTAGNRIEYVTIATTGNAISFGTLSTQRVWTAGSASATRGLFFNGENTVGTTSSIDYVTIATAGSAVNFGNTSAATFRIASCASSTRALVGGGGVFGGTNAISFVTIATTGNTTSFGQLTAARGDLTACSSENRGVFAGGSTSGGRTNIIDYVTIASTGNAIDFGDLLDSTTNPAASSNGHGGLS